MHGDK